MPTATLTDNALAILSGKVDELNKRAARNGLEPLTLRVLGRNEVRDTYPNGVDRIDYTNDVELTGVSPRIDGWQVIARIEFTDNGNLVHVAPSIGNIDNKYRTIDNRCDHCNTRRRRNDVIVLRNDDGSEICVGRNCVADFIRDADADALIDFAKLLGNLESMVNEACEEDMGGGEREVIAYPLVSVLQNASIVIRKIGWVSATKAREEDVVSTKENVSALLNPPRNAIALHDWEKWVRKLNLVVTDFDKELAARALEWVRNVEPGDSDYLHNIKLLALSDTVAHDKLGYVVSIISAYQRETNKQVERAARPESVYYGVAGKRNRNIQAECKGLRSFDGYYGVTTMVKFEAYIDGKVAPIVWFASGDRTPDFEVGEEYTFDATVKKHEEHETYGKQTIVNRVTVR